MVNALEAVSISVGYGSKTVIENLNLTLVKGGVYAVVGPNGCGKSTLIKALARSLPTQSGTILVNNKAITSFSSKELAREIALLPQSPKIPEQFTAEEVIRYGRFPHSNWSGSLNEEDHLMIQEAMEITEVHPFAQREMNHLSGGERQRVWIAMALAQEADTLLLDEPTTFLDIGHQYQTLELIAKLNQKEGKTILMVLHDLNQAARYADHIFLMSEGTLIHQGSPTEILTEKILSDVFSMKGKIHIDEETQSPYFLPHSHRGSQ